MRQVVDLLVEDATDTSLCSYSLQELFDAVVGLRNVCMDLFPDLEFPFPYEVAVLIQRAFLDDHCIFVDFDFGRYIRKLIFGSDL